MFIIGHSRDPYNDIRREREEVMWEMKKICYKNMKPNK